MLEGLYPVSVRGHTGMKKNPASQFDCMVYVVVSDLRLVISRRIISYIPLSSSSVPFLGPNLA